MCNFNIPGVAHFSTKCLILDIPSGVRAPLPPSNQDAAEHVEIDGMFSFCGYFMVYRGFVNVQSKPFQPCELLALQA